MSQGAQVVRNEYLLGAVVTGTTFVRQIQLFHADIARQMGYPYGGCNWGAEFGIMDSEVPGKMLAVASSSNGKLTWTENGTLVFSFSALETSMWTWERGSYYLDLVDPTISFDPMGTRINILRGQIKTVSHASE